MKYFCTYPGDLLPFIPLVDYRLGGGTCCHEMCYYHFVENTHYNIAIFIPVMDNEHTNNEPSEACLELCM